ncbi:uncharacterized protein LOC135713058 [Ochlerotatus camptorhynchus]|uniref:uncharacterized protein LOC135713058 n=1 Tax=Ochlerotatus camptorhynchus TaxID=644619 RepID=UPI0031CDF8D1
MPFIEGLTISGFPEQDDLTLRFQAGLNILDSRHPESNVIVDSLSWFLNCPETLDIPPETNFTAQSYLEVRIRSDQPEHSFWELRGKKKCPNENVIHLRRVLSKPHTVLVDGKNSQVPFDEFRFEMAQLGFCFGMNGFPTLNVVRRIYLDQLIKPASMLWNIVHAGLRVEAFGRMQDEEQDMKDFYRKQLNSALTFDYQSKIDEFKERIESSKMFCRLQKTLNMYAASVVQREVNAYARVSKLYESQLEKSVAAMETLEEQRQVLEERLDEHENAVPEMRELVLEDLKGHYSEVDYRLAKLEPEEHVLDLIENVQVRILDKAEMLKSTLKNMLGPGGKWIQKYKKVAKLEAEMEIAEICLHASIFPVDVRGEILEKTHNSLAMHLETSKISTKSIQNTMESVTLAIQERRKLLQIIEGDREYDVGETTGYVNELVEIFRNLTQAKLASVTLQKDIRQKSYALLQQVTAINHISSEIIMGVASIENFLQTSNDNGLKQNFTGFVWQHFKINVPAVANLALPHLTDLLTLAIFHKQDVMLEMLAHLPLQNTYNVLALDKFVEHAEQLTPNVPSNVYSLSNLLGESPLKPILTHLMRTFYYTKVPYEKISKSIDPEIVLICVTDKLVIGGGFLSGGWSLNAQNTLEKLSEAVSLQVDILKLELELREHTETIPNLERLKDDTWNKLEQFHEDTFDRFHRLLQAFPTLSDLPFLLEQLVHQQTSLTRQQVRLDLLGEFSKHLKTDQFQDQTFYEQRIHDGNNALEQGKREWHSDRKTLDKTLVQLKDDVRILEELLVNAETLRTFSLPLKLHQSLVVHLSEFKDELEHTLQHLSQEHAGQQSAFDVMDQLDLIHRETIEAERVMMLHSFLLREMSTFYQELRRQYPAKASKLQKKTKADLQYVYEARRKLNCTQPAYNLAQIERFKFKLEMCRNHLQMLTAYRTPLVCNMTLPCINKLAAIKLRLITQMMANIPSYLNKSGSLRLNFQYDRTKCSDEDSKKSAFNIEHIIGLTVEFVDEEQNLIRYLNGDSATLAHLIFFACFLSVEGCKLLLLQDCFSGLSEEEHQDAYTLLLAISQNMQIFLTVGLDE